MTNRFAGTCADCGNRVHAGDGVAFKDAGKWLVAHIECPDDLYQRMCAEAYEAHRLAESERPVREAWRNRVAISTDQSAWYDTTLYQMLLPAGESASHVRHILAGGDGLTMASYGKFGGYSTIGRVTDNGDGTLNVESVYHIGD